MPRWLACARIEAELVAEEPRVPMRVLRFSHSAVVSAWRERERQLRRDGLRVRLFTAKSWNEGGAQVPFRADGDTFAGAVRTFGTHPNLFVFDPRAVWRALRAEAWDVIDVHEEPCSLAVAELFALHRLAHSDAPVVLYSAQNIDKRYPPPFRWLEGAALHRAAGVSVCNHDAGQILRRKGLRGVVAEIPLGVDLTAFAPADRAAPGEHADAVADSGQGAALGVSGGPLRVGYVGRLEERKGVGVAIEAVAALPDATLDVIGSGPEQARFAQQVRERGTAERVRFLGSLSGAALAEAYRSLDVLVVPSLPTPNWLEQFGRVVAEAMAAGVPVVASRSGALPDVVGDAGLLVEPGDAAALTAQLRRLATDPRLWRELRDRGLDRAQEFTWSAVADGMITLYRRVGGTGAEPSRTDRPLEVVVVAYGAPDKLRAALEPLGGDVPITIVDNSASPQTAALAARFGARYLDPGANLGFGAAVNLALRSIDPGADVVLLNPDARIEAAALRRLHDHLAADAGLAAVAPAQVDNDGVESIVHWPFPTPRRAVGEAVGLSRLGWRGEFLIGSILLLRREAIEAVGPFDERFFLYAEETDWQRRAADAGWRMALISTIRGEHEGAGTDADPAWRETQFTASLEQYVRKHHGSVGWQLFRAAGLGGALVRATVLRGPARAAARRRARLYLRGPVRCNARLTRPGAAS